MKTLILTLISVSLVNNVVLSQFLGLCPFLGVSKQTKTAMSMGGAVIFVITIASAVTHLLYRLLVLLHVEYLETVAFILIIAALVQFVELFLKKYFPPLYNSTSVSKDNNATIKSENPYLENTLAPTVTTFLN